MHCSEAKPQLSAMASGGVGPDREAALRAHLDSCEECSLEMELLVSALSAPPAEPESDRLDVEALEDTVTPAPATPESATPESAPGSVPPPAPLPPPNSDWTVEKIFGNDGGPAAAPTPEGGPPSVTSVVATPIVETEAVPNASKESTTPQSRLVPEAWDFEPADAARDATPPEESLLFAEQALNRRIDDPKRQGAIRAILWAGSAIVGLGLLGVSLWMAMGMHEAPPQEIAARAKHPAVPSNGTQAQAPTLVGQPMGSSEPAAADVPLPENAPADPQPPSTPEATPAPIKSSLTPKSPVPVPPSASSGTKPAGSKAAAPPKHMEPLSSSPPKAGATSREHMEKPAVAPPPTSVKRDEDDMWPTDDPVPPKRAVAPSTPESRPPAPSGSAVAPATGSTSAPRPSETVAPPTPEAPPAELKPIDRLHAATVQAAKDQDLIALRRLKTSWKNLLRTVVGPDRARAKREFAECLWDIQAMTGRDADQQEALLAYRDYLLSAPAGGADARSAARLRELEDALSERR